MTTEAERIQPSSASSFSERIGEFVDRIDYQKMQTPEQLEDVYRLRYDAYRREEFIDANADMRCVDPFDQTPNHAVYGLYLEGKLISSLRVHVLNKKYRESPSSLIFSDTLDPLMDRNKVLIDPTRFTTNLDASRKYKALPYATVRVAAMASAYHNADYCLSCIRPEHAAFYKKVCRSEQIGEVRYFPKVNFPVVLYAATKSICENVWQRYPFFLAKNGEAERLFGSSPVQPKVESRYLESVAEP